MSKQQKELLKNLAETSCRLGKSKIQGIGVLAIKNIKKGSNPFKYTSGECIKYKITPLTKTDLKKAKIDKNVMKMIDDFIHPLEGIYYIPHDGLNSMDITFFLNHSDKPNVKWVEGDDGCDYGTFVTIKNIKEGDELTIDYRDY
jgi:SET domain-containing protein